MKLRQLALLVLLTGLLFSAVNAQENRKPITNSDIISMVEDGVPEENIIKAINSLDNEFDVSPNSIRQLYKSKVSSKVIGVMQDSQASKNLTRATTTAQTSGSLSSFGTVTTTQSPTPTPFTPIIQWADLFKFSLEKCSISSIFSTSVTCQLTITNTGQTRQLNISNKDTEMIYDTGKTSKYNSYKLGEATGNSTFNIDGGIKFLSKTSVKSLVEFYCPTVNTQKIERLTIGFNSIPGRNFTIQFRDIQLEKSTFSFGSEAPSQFNNQTIQGTWDESTPEKERQKREAEQKRNDAINKIIRKIP